MKGMRSPERCISSIAQKEQGKPLQRGLPEVRVFIFQPDSPSSLAWGSPGLHGNTRKNSLVQKVLTFPSMAVCQCAEQRQSADQEQSASPYQIEIHPAFFQNRQSQLLVHDPGNRTHYRQHCNGMERYGQQQHDTIVEVCRQRTGWKNNKGE